MNTAPLVRRVLIALALASTPGVLGADSVGSFCSVPGLLAFDAFIPGEPGRLIKIVRFDAAGGIQPEEEVKLTEDLQIHGIVCRPGEIEVYYRDHLYIIDTGLPLASKVREKRRSTAHRGTAAQGNLANYARRAGVIVLQPTTEVDRFELVIAKGSFFVAGEGGRTYTSTDLVHLVHGEMKQHRRLFFGTTEENAH